MEILLNERAIIKPELTGYFQKSMSTLENITQVDTLITSAADKLANGEKLN